MISKLLLCMLLMITYVWAIPIASDVNAIAPSDGIMPINTCPIPMCLAIELPCDDIRLSYVVVNGQRCPMCHYCASKTTVKPKTPVRCRTTTPVNRRMAY